MRFEASSKVKPLKKNCPCVCVCVCAQAEGGRAGERVAKNVSLLSSFALSRRRRSSRLAAGGDESNGDTELGGPEEGLKNDNKRDLDRLLYLAGPGLNLNLRELAELTTGRAQARPPRLLFNFSLIHFMPLPLWLTILAQLVQNANVMASASSLRFIFELGPGGRCSTGQN